MLLRNYVLTYRHIHKQRVTGTQLGTDLEPDVENRIHSHQTYRVTRVTLASFFGLCGGSVVANQTGPVSKRKSRVHLLHAEFKIMQIAQLHDAKQTYSSNVMAYF